MDAAYVDTSVLVAILFDEPGGKAAATRLARYDEVFSSNLLEAELAAVCAREKAEMPVELRTSISWILPDRALSDEIAVTLAAGYVRGADLWHLACALYLAEDPGAIAFLTLDERQREVAKKMGFTT
jgi:predicted nucleic acid-binding protein